MGWSPTLNTNKKRSGLNPSVYLSLLPGCGYSVTSLLILASGLSSVDGLCWKPKQTLPSFFMLPTVRYFVTEIRNVTNIENWPQGVGRLLRES